jgi:hypothetical protein
MLLAFVAGVALALLLGGLAVKSNPEDWTYGDTRWAHKRKLRKP